MKSICVRVTGKILVVAAGIFFALTIAGCGDQTVADFEANRRRMGEDCRRDLRHGLAAYVPASQAPTFRPAP